MTEFFVNLHAALTVYSVKLARSGALSLVSTGDAAGVVDICLIPEVEFSLEKLGEYVQKLLAKKGHTVRGMLTRNPSNPICMPPSGSLTFVWHDAASSWCHPAAAAGVLKAPDKEVPTGLVALSWPLALLPCLAGVLQPAMLGHERTVMDLCPGCMHQARCAVGRLSASVQRRARPLDGAMPKECILVPAGDMRGGGRGAGGDGEDAGHGRERQPYSGGRGHLPPGQAQVRDQGARAHVGGAP